MRARAAASRDRETMAVLQGAARALAAAGEAAGALAAAGAAVLRGLGLVEVVMVTLEEAARARVMLVMAGVSLDTEIQAVEVVATSAVGEPEGEMEVGWAAEAMDEGARVAMSVEVRVGLGRRVEQVAHLEDAARAAPREAMVAA